MKYFRSIVLITFLLFLFSCNSHKKEKALGVSSSSIEESKSKGLFISYYTPDKPKVILKRGKSFTMPNAWAEKQHYYEDGELVITDGINITVPYFASPFFDLTTSRKNEIALQGIYNSYNPTTGFVSQLDTPKEKVTFYLKEGIDYKRMVATFDTITHVIIYSKRKGSQDN